MLIIKVLLFITCSFISKLYLFALFVIDHQSSAVDRVCLCLCLSNKVGRPI
jgi:hypothetical protein